MHVGSPSDLNQTVAAKAKPKYVYSILKTHGQCFRGQGEAELHTLDFKTTQSEFQKPSWTIAERGEAELLILNFKTTWSEFQKPSQTATERGEAELCILDFQTTQSECQKPVRPLSCEAKPSYVHTILKKHHLLRVGPKQLCASAHLGCTRAAGTSQYILF